MALMNIFRKKKKIEEKKVVQKPESKKEVPAKTTPPPKIRTFVSDKIYQILKTPHITEKATDLMRLDQYVFQVFQNSNKREVKEAVENLFGVDVLSVKILRTQKKQRRMGRISGWKPGFKKAIVKIKKGQKIESLPK